MWPKEVGTTSYYHPSWQTIEMTTRVGIDLTMLLNKDTHHSAHVDLYLHLARACQVPANVGLEIASIHFWYLHLKDCPPFNWTMKIPSAPLHVRASRVSAVPLVITLQARRWASAEECLIA